MKILYRLTIVLFLTIGIGACSDFLNPSTPQKKLIESIDGVRDLQSLIIGAHDQLSRLGLYGAQYIIYGEVRTTNAFTVQTYDEVALFNYLPGDESISGAWDAAYTVISNCNLIIDSAVQGGGKVKQVKGQAYALRALSHMILLELYGQQNVEGSNMGVPYITDYVGDKQSFFPKRLSVEATYKKIEADFEKALSLMDPSDTQPSTMMTYYGALSLEARLYMKMGKYAKAAAAAKEVIDSGVYSLVPASQYLEAWGTDGQPAFIFGIAYSKSDHIPIDGLMSMIKQPSYTKAVYGEIEVTKMLYNLYEANDIRKELYKIWPESVLPKGRLKYRMSGKYPSSTTNIPVIRYAEVILTYAEAKARPGPQQNLVVAKTYLNKIPSSRNASTYNTASISNILLERRKELAFEGRYYWTLMRTKQDIVKEALRPTVSFMDVTIPYGDSRLALPIPDDEVTANPNIKQNKGYRVN